MALYTYYHICNDYSLKSVSDGETVEKNIAWRKGGRINKAVVDLGWEGDDVVYLRTLDDYDLSGKFI